MDNKKITSSGVNIDVDKHEDEKTKERKEFAEWLGIPYRTMQEWELGRRAMPQYVLDLIAYKVRNEKEKGKI